MSALAIVTTIVAAAFIIGLMIAIGVAQAANDQDWGKVPLEPKVYKSVAAWILEKNYQGSPEDLLIELHLKGHIVGKQTFEEIMISEEDYLEIEKECEITI